MDRRTHNQDMAALCRDLAKNLPTGKPPRSYLLDLAISYEQAGDSVYAFAGSKPNVNPAEKPDGPSEA